MLFQKHNWHVMTHLMCYNKSFEIRRTNYAYMKHNLLAPICN